MGVLFFPNQNIGILLVVKLTSGGTRTRNPTARRSRCFPISLPSRMWSIVSCIIRYYFNPCGTGSHLYPANTNTLRSDHWAEVLLALVGTHLSWSPCPPLLYSYYTTDLAVCQEFFLWVSLRLVPNTPSGLVHIYIPHNGATVRSRTLSSWSNTTLVGLALLASAMLPSLCFYYSTLLTICQVRF